MVSMVFHRFETLLWNYFEITLNGLLYFMSLNAYHDTYLKWLFHLL